MPAAYFISLTAGDESSDRRVVQHSRLFIAAAHPFKTVIDYKVEEDLAREGVFADPPTTNAYTMRLPVDGLRVRYRLLDQRGHQHRRPEQPEQHGTDRDGEMTE